MSSFNDLRMKYNTRITIIINEVIIMVIHNKFSR